MPKKTMKTTRIKQTNKKRMPKMQNMEGEGLKEIAQSVYNKGKQLYNFGKNVYNEGNKVYENLKKKRYVGRAVEI